MTSEQATRDLLSAINHMPQPIKWNGVDIIATRGGLNRGDSLIPGGYLGEAEVELTICLKTIENGKAQDLYGAPPRQGDDVEMDDVAYRIASKPSVDPMKVGCIVTLENAAK